MLDTRSYVPPVLNARASVTRPAHLLTPVTAAAAAGGCKHISPNIYGILMTANAFTMSGGGKVISNNTLIPVSSCASALSAILLLLLR